MNDLSNLNAHESRYSRSRSKPSASLFLISNPSDERNERDNEYDERNNKREGRFFCPNKKKTFRNDG